MEHHSLNRYGNWIVDIEGNDLTGKETQSKLLTEFLRNECHETVQYISFPNYEAKWCSPVKDYLSGNLGELDPKSVSMLFALDRNETINSQYTINVDYTVFDRYVASNMIHQSALSCFRAGRNYMTQKEYGIIEGISKLEYGILKLPVPDRILLLAMSKNVHKELVNKTLGETGGDDINEKNRELVEITNTIAMQIAGFYGWTIVSCDDGKELYPIEKIQDEIRKIVFPSSYELV